MGRSGNRNSPSALVLVVWRRPVLLLVHTTSASGTAASVASTTVPVSVATDWATARPEATRATSAEKRTTAIIKNPLAGFVVRSSYLASVHPTEPFKNFSTGATIDLSSYRFSKGSVLSA